MKLIRVCYCTFCSSYALFHVSHIKMKRILFAVFFPSIFNRNRVKTFFAFHSIALPYISSYPILFVYIDKKLSYYSCPLFTSFHYWCIFYKWILRSCEFRIKINISSTELPTWYSWKSLVQLWKSHPTAMLYVFVLCLSTFTTATNRANRFSFIPSLKGKITTVRCCLSK